MIQKFSKLFLLVSCVLPIGLYASSNKTFNSLQVAGPLAVTGLASVNKLNVKNGADFGGDVGIDGTLFVDNSIVLDSCLVLTCTWAGQLLVNGSPVATAAEGGVTSSATACAYAVARFNNLSTTDIDNAPLVAPNIVLPASGPLAGDQSTSSLQAQDCSTADINLALVPLGAGALVAAVPDGVNGGNQRGGKAVDWQLRRSSPSQVASGPQSVVSGGRGNTASGDYSTVGGGISNMASGDSSTIAGGSNNQVYSPTATVGGGSVNIITGNAATIPGGSENRADGDYSFAAGLEAHATDTGSFVWADSTGSIYPSNGLDTFNVRATGGAFFTNDADVGGALSYGSNTSLNATLYPFGTTTVPGLKSAYASFVAGPSPETASGYVTANITSIIRNSAGNYTINYTAAGFSASSQPIVLATVAHFNSGVTSDNDLAIITNAINYATCALWTTLNGAPSDYDAGGAAINFSFLALGA